MALLGVSTLDELEPRHVTQLARMVPVATSLAQAASALA
jgi:L-lactate dehydrogenase (cytochrome)